MGVLLVKEGRVYEEDEGWKHIGPNDILVEVWRFQGETGLFFFFCSPTTLMLSSHCTEKAVP